MKKLNRKGFTLIELLAVIVVLAIVLVVTIPSVLRSVGNARVKSLENSANAVADWLTRQYELQSLQGTGVTTDTPYRSLPATLGTSTSKTTLDDALLKAAGFGGGTSDATGQAWKDSAGKICVTLTVKSGGRFDNLKDDDGNTVTSKTSAGC